MAEHRHRPSYKHHSHDLKADPKWVRKFVKVGDVFKTMGVRDQLYPFKVIRLTEQGRVVLERKMGAAPIETKTLCVKFEYGVPTVQYRRKITYSLDGQTHYQGRIAYDAALDDGVRTVIGKRFRDTFGRGPMTIVGVEFVNYRHRYLKTEPSSGASPPIVGFIGPDKPIQVMEEKWAVESIKKWTGSEFYPALWKRDYSVEVEIVLCCYAWGIPKDVALYIVELFDIANYHHYKQ